MSYNFKKYFSFHLSFSSSSFFFFYLSPSCCDRSHLPCSEFPYVEDSMSRNTSSCDQQRTLVLSPNSTRKSMSYHQPCVTLKAEPSPFRNQDEIIGPADTVIAVLEETLRLRQPAELHLDPLAIETTR